MSVLASLFAGPVQTLSDSDGWMVRAMNARKSTAGIHVTEDSALSASSVFACVRAICEDVAKLPLIVYRRIQPEGKERATDLPLYHLLHDAPNPEMISFDVRQAVGVGALLWGNGYAEVVRDNAGNVLEIWPVHPRLVKPDRNADGNLVYVVAQPTTLLAGRPRDPGELTSIPAEDMIHIKGFGDNGLIGFMLAQLAQESIGLALAAERFGASFFGNGAVHSGIMNHPSKMSPEAQSRFREVYEREFAGSDKAFKLLVLEEGMSFERTSANPEEAQAVEARQFQVEDIARWFRVPPHKIQHLLRSTFSNIEHQAIEYVGDTILPWLVKWEQELKRRLIGPGRQDLFIEHLQDVLLRADALTRARVHQIEFLNGALTSDEWRSQENRNPLPDDLGKRHYVQRNLVPVERIDEERNQGSAPANQPPDTNRPRGDVALAKKVSARVLAQAAEAVIRKEANACSRAARKHGQDFAALGEWCGGFYAEHRQYVVEYLTPGAESMAELMSGEPGLDVDTAREVSRVVEAFADEHVAAAQADVMNAAASGAVESVTKQWVVDKPATMAERLTETIADYLNDEVTE